MSKKEMLINVSQGEECRIALIEDGRLEELYMERTSSTSHVGNIYKGRVTNVEPSIQAAFIDFGLGRNGFLHISDLMPEYFGGDSGDYQETVGRKMARRDRPPIQRCLRRGDDIVVQIIKEGIGTKGPTLSTYLSIPGRILVMMPGMGKMGISRKIEDEEERRRLRQILDSLKPPKDVGFIIRTAGIGKAKTEIQRDLTYLTRLWQNFVKKRDSGPPPMELYTEGDLVTRTVRDVFSADVDAIVADNKEVAKRVKEVIKLANPRARNKVELYEQGVPLFHKYGIEREIEQMYSRHVPLPSGGSLVIDSTEAIVAIDVNSGKFREHNDPETTAFRTDMEAADEIPRQLRLRDLGGVIICDFIDLRYERHRRELEKRLHDNFQKDRAKTKVLRMSQFGIIEVTRQRMRPSLKRSIYFDCPHCKGAGLVKTPESMSLDVMRRLAIAANDLKVARIEMSVCGDVNFYLQNKKRHAIADLEARLNKKIIIKTDPTLGLDQMNLVLYDARDGLVILEELGMEAAPPHVTQLGPRVHQGGQSGRGRPERGRGRGRFDDRRGGRDQRGPRQERELPPPRQDEFENAEEVAEEREEEFEGEVAESNGGSAETQPPAGEVVAYEAPSAQENPEEPGDNIGNVAEAAGSERSSQRPEGQDRNEGGGHRRRRRRRGRGGQGGQGGPQGHGGYSQNRQPDQRGRDNQHFDRQRQPQEQAVGSEYVEEYDVGDEPQESGQNRPAEEPARNDQGGGKRRRRRRGGRGRRRGRAGEQPAESFAGERESASTEPPEVEEIGEAPEEIAETDLSESGHAPSEEAASPRRRPPGGRGRGRSRKAPAPRELDSPAPPPTAADPAKPTVVEDHNALRTGTADRHLAGDEPVAPQPVSRPRSFRDLDDIPDDFD